MRDNLRALDELVEISKGTRLKLQYSHAIFVGTSTFKTKDELHRILDDLRKEGVDAWFDIYNETMGVSVMTVFLPSWFQSLSPEERRMPKNRLRLGTVCNSLVLKMLGFGWKDIVIAYLGPGLEKYEGKSVAEMASATPDRERAFGIARVFINGHQVLSGAQLDKEALKTSGHAVRV